MVTSTDPNGLATTFAYDTLRRPTQMSQAIGTTNGESVTYAYDDVNFAVTTTTSIDASKSIKQITALDKLARPNLATTEDGSNNVISIVSAQYDLLGRVYRTSNPYTTSASNWTTSAFDVLGRPTSVTLQDNSQTTYSYATNTATVKDPAGKQRKSQRDGAGRMTVVFEPDITNGNQLTQQTSYAYNVLDQPTLVTQGSQTRTYAYDALGRLLSATTPEAGSACFGSVTSGTCNADGYDSFDNLQKRTDARGVVTNYSYDGLNRLTQVGYNVGTTGVPATPAVTLTYGSNAAQFNNGRLTTMTDGVGSENYTYNNLGQMTQLQKVISGTTYTTSYSFNLAGELAQITYPSGRAVTQSVDAIGRLSSITGTLNSVNTTYASGFGYNTAGQVTGFSYGNGVAAAFGYSADRLQLTSLSYAKGTQTLFGLNYWYKQDATNCTGGATGNNGQVQCITDSVDAGRGAVYTFDALARLSSAVTTGSTGYPKWGLSFTYDRYGNRTGQSVTAGTGPSNSVTIDATTNRITGTPYSYDLNGNMTNDGLNTLTYDAENRAVSAAGATYTYDGNNLRVKKVSGSTTTVYIFSGSKVIAEYVNGAAVGSPTREYIYSGSQLLAKIEGGVTNYYHADHLSARVTTDSSGNKIGEQAHFPFGESWYSANTTTKFLFTSYERDPESGNDYAMARYNVNRLGRFSSPDPLAGSLGDPQSLNRYSYVRNDPVDLTDPKGLCPKWGPYASCGPALSGGADFFVTPGPWEPGILACGVDPFCIQGGGIGPFGSPAAQIHCASTGCMVGSYVSSQYNSGVGYVVDWEAQRKAEIQAAVNTFLEQAQKIADALGITLDELLAAQNVDSNDPKALKPLLQGGNWNFLKPPGVLIPSDCNTSVGGVRCGSFPSLHFPSDHPGYVHLDTANIGSLFGISAVVHLTVDVILGNTILASGIPRP